MSRFLCTLLFTYFFISFSFAQTNHTQVPFVKSILSENNIASDYIYITDHYTSQGITHTYYKQAINEIPVFNSRGAIHYSEQNDVIVKHLFKKSTENLIIPNSHSLSAKDAVLRVAEKKELDLSGDVLVLEPSEGAIAKQKIRASKISLRDITSSLEYYFVTDNELKLVWQIPIEDVNTAWFTNYLVDANSGEIIKEIHWTVECNHGNPNKADHICENDHSHDHSEKNRRSESVAPNSYEVFAWPVESPNFGSRSSQTSPWLDNVVASPNGWHTIGENSYTTSRGNNTDTYLDDDNTNSPTGGDAARADGGATLDFFFDLDTSMAPTDYIDASITNTFYWTNLMHDVWYNYGFDEASGNFQEENYTTDGIGSDYVQSEAQDASGTCNANFATPPDGMNPRMQMYLCTMNGNFRDGDYDNAVIAHEFGHGISTRMTGGPASSGCLFNQEQMGEGWSDYFGIVMTIESGDLGSDSRGIGTWLFGEGPDDGGIRSFPYSDDFGVNPMTYNYIKTESIPHGVGAVWCTMLWDLTWALIDEYGFDTDIYNGTGGNNLAMQLVMEGIKLQPCSPGFIDGRDAILEADMMINGGANSCLIWNAFAKRGLGYSASQGSSFSRSDGVEAFDLPPTCRLKIKKSTPSISATESDQILYQVIVENNFFELDLSDILLKDFIPEELTFVSASNGGFLSGDVINWPLFNLSANEADTIDIVLEVKSGLPYVVSDIYDDVESGATIWKPTSFGSTSWSEQTAVFNSSTTSWFAPDNNTTGTAQLDISEEIGIGSGSVLSFFHSYDTENNWDGGQVLISIDEGLSWNDLGPNMIVNGYNNVIFNSIPGFSGNSNGFINTIIDLDSYAGHNVLVRFQMNCNETVGGNGWWIDDIAITNLQLLAINHANVSSDTYTDSVNSSAVQILPPSSVFQSSFSKTDVLCYGEPTGQITTAPQGGSGAYTWEWNDGITSQNRLNLNAGIYRVTISDGVDELVKVGIISEPSEINLTFTVVEPTNAAEDNGSIDLFVTGGTGDYDYLWETGDMTSSISGLVPGVYSVTVTDDNGCEKIGSAEVVGISCNYDIFDSGGQSFDYSNKEDNTYLICSDVPNKDVVLTFNSLDIQNDFDALYVYNGNSINSPLFDSGNPATQAGFPAGGYYGTNPPGPFLAANESGCITLHFLSDEFITGDGWDITVNCAIACAPEVMNVNADGFASLKRQILCADPVDVIDFASNVFLGSIPLDATIIIDKELIINPGVGNTIHIISNTLGPIFSISSTGSLELDNINLYSGETDPGGGIINNGTLILKDVDVYENENVVNPNGVILNNGQLLIRGNSTLKKE